MDTSIQSIDDNEAFGPQDVMCLAENAEDIHKHLRESDVCNQYFKCLVCIFMKTFEKGVN